MEQDAKDITIATLKADNFELRKSERNYNVLNSQLLDLEHRFKLLQEEKYRAERDAKEHEALLYQKTDNLNGELRLANDALLSRQKEVKDIDTELYAYKGLLEEKGSVLNSLKKELADLDLGNSTLAREKRLVESDLLVSRDSKMKAEAEVDNLAAVNDRILKNKQETEARAHETEEEVAALRRKLEDLEVQIDITKKDKAQKEAELSVVLDAKAANQNEAGKTSFLNSKLYEETKDLSNKAKDMEVQLFRLKQRYEDSLAMLEIKDKDLAKAENGLNFTEDRNTTANAELKKLKQENEALQRLLDSYRKDVDFQKRLREEETAKKLELEYEKRKLTNEALSKEIEARVAKRELEKVKDTHGQLLDDKLNINQELDALRQHAEVLESQNIGVSLELFDRI